MNLKVSMKIDGKWVTVGNIKKNQWGNLSLGMRKSPEVQNALQGEGWANFALFEDKPKVDEQTEATLQTIKKEAKPSAYDDDGDSIPF